MDPYNILTLKYLIIGKYDNSSIRFCHILPTIHTIKATY